MTELPNIRNIYCPSCERKMFRLGNTDLQFMPTIQQNTATTPLLYADHWFEIWICDKCKVQLKFKITANTFADIRIKAKIQNYKLLSEI